MDLFSLIKEPEKIVENKPVEKKVVEPIKKTSPIPQKKETQYQPYTEQEAQENKRFNLINLLCSLDQKHTVQNAQRVIDAAKSMDELEVNSLFPMYCTSITTKIVSMRYGYDKKGRLNQLRNLKYFIENVGK